jgi:hypothetical protein
MKYGTNVWAAVRGYLDQVTDTATTFMIMQSLRLDYGVGSQVHPRRSNHRSGNGPSPKPAKDRVKGST